MFQHQKNSNIILLLVWVLFISCSSTKEKKSFQYGLGLGPKESEVIKIIMESIEDIVFHPQNNFNIYADYFDKDFLYGERLKVLDIGFYSQTEGEFFHYQRPYFIENAYEGFELASGISPLKPEQSFFGKCNDKNCFTDQRTVLILVKGKNSLFKKVPAFLTTQFFINGDAKQFEISQLQYLSHEFISINQNDPLKQIPINSPFKAFVQRRLIKKGMPIKFASMALNVSEDYFNKYKTFNSDYFKNIESDDGKITNYEILP